MKLNLHPDARSLGHFAWTCPIGFPLVGYLAHSLGAPEAVAWSVAALGPVALGAHFLGLRIVPLTAYRMIALVGWPIGSVVVPLLIALIFYGVFTPMGLFFRLLGRDAMARRTDPRARTYWVDRGPPRTADSYFKLY